MQGRLLDRHGEVPPPPESIDLSNPPRRPAEDAPAPTAPMASNPVEDLQMAARAAEHAATVTGNGGTQKQEGGSSNGTRAGFMFNQLVGTDIAQWEAAEYLNNLECGTVAGLGVKANPTST